MTTTLVWKRGSYHQIVSECKTYKVCQTGCKQWLRYTAWKKVSPLCDITLGVFNNAQDAKQRCLDDFEQERR